MAQMLAGPRPLGALVNVLRDGPLQDGGEESALAGTAAAHARARLFFDVRLAEINEVVE